MAELGIFHMLRLPRRPFAARRYLRAFACAATSQGHMNDSTSSYTVQSIFGLMTTHAVSWKIFGYNAEPLTRGNYPDTVQAPDTCFGKFAEFQADGGNTGFCTR